MTPTDLEKFLDLTDPAERAEAVEVAIDELQQMVARLSVIRSGAVAELKAQGWSLQQVADRLGISKTRAAQLASGFERTEPPAPAGQRWGQLVSLVDRLNTTSPAQERLRAAIYGGPKGNAAAKRRLEAAIYGDPKGNTAAKKRLEAAIHGDPKGNTAAKKRLEAAIHGDPKGNTAAKKRLEAAIHGDPKGNTAAKKRLEAAIHGDPKGNTAAKKRLEAAIHGDPKGNTAAKKRLEAAIHGDQRSPGKHSR